MTSPDKTQSGWEFDIKDPNQSKIEDTTFEHIQIIEMIKMFDVDE
jgi:hypothetical protein